jgi:perosamine synthetase
MNFVDSIVDRIRHVVGSELAPLHEPSLKGNELAYVSECIQTGWVSSVGSFVDRFERQLVAYTGASHAVVMSNGTSALQIAMHLAGVEKDNEVLLPALSFVATANAVRHNGAWPHFVDSEARTLGLDPFALASYLTEISEQRNDGLYNLVTGRRIAAIVPMHTFGHPVDMPELVKVASRFGIPIVEDAAESLGSFLDGRHTGNMGLCATLSFNGNKIVTSGGGGAIITNNEVLAKRAKHLTTTAKQPHPWAFFHDEVAYNFRLPNINAALGCAQLERIDSFVEAKRELTLRYSSAFADIEGATLFIERPNTRANYWLQTLILSEDHAYERDQVLKASNSVGIMTRPVWELLNTLPMYLECPCAPLPVAKDLARRIVNIPSSPQLIQGIS